jgi:hypothetical protein
MTSEPYQKAESYMNNIQVDVTEKMLTEDAYKDMVKKFEDRYKSHVLNIVAKLKGGRPTASIKYADDCWDSLEIHGWKTYKHKYEKASRIRQREQELKQQHYEDRKASREARRVEKKMKQLRETEQAKEKQFKASQSKDSSKPKKEAAVSEAESEEESESEAEVDFSKEAKEEVDEVEVQDQSTMNPGVPSITSKRLGNFTTANTLATFSHTLTKEKKLNPANGILILERLDDILRAESEKLAERNKIRMNLVSIHKTGKIVCSDRPSDYKTMHKRIQQTIAELKEKTKPASKASSSSSKSSSRR